MKKHFVLFFGFLLVLGYIATGFTVNESLVCQGDGVVVNINNLK